MEASTITHLYPAQKLDPKQRQDLALQAIQNKTSISNIAKQTNVSRKFLYEQKNKAINAVSAEFNKSDDKDVLFYLPVTKSWIISFILCLLLHCRSSMRGIQKVLIDAFDYSISIGTIAENVKSAGITAKTINTQQDLSNIKIATPNELFQHNKPILAGVDARSLFCYLLSKEQHRDAETWQIHLMDLKKQNFNPDRFIADDADGLRLGHKNEFKKTPCDGDVFHIIQDMMDVRRFFRNQYKSALSSLLNIEHKMEKAILLGKNHQYDDELLHARSHEKQMHYLSKTIDTLVSWMQHDVFELPGVNYSGRSELYDFNV